MKLTDAEVAEIRAKADVPLRVFAERFGVSTSQVSRVRSGKGRTTPRLSPRDRRAKVREQAAFALGRDLEDDECCCGCGGKTAIARSTDPFGRVAGLPVNYLPRHARKAALTHIARDCGFDSECWLSTRTPSARRPLVGGRLAYRIAYETQVGPIPRGADVHHLCDNKRCVNPEHLIALSPRDHRQLHTFLHRRSPQGVLRTA